MGRICRGGWEGLKKGGCEGFGKGGLKKGVERRRLRWTDFAHVFVGEGRGVLLKPEI